MAMNFAHFIEPSAYSPPSGYYVTKYRAAMIEDFRKFHERYGGIRYGHNFNPAVARTRKEGSS